jgi:hypothetical protein
MAGFGIEHEDEDEDEDEDEEPPAGHTATDAVAWEVRRTAEGRVLYADPATGGSLDEPPAAVSAARAIALLEAGRNGTEPAALQQAVHRCPTSPPRPTLHL